MRALFDLLKIIFVGALLFSTVRCDSHLKDKYRAPAPRHNVP